MLRNLMLVLMAGITLLSLLILTLHLLRPVKSPPPTPGPSLTIERIQSLATLVTTRLTVHTELSLTVHGYLGDLTVDWSGPGSVLLGPDLCQASVVDRDDANRTATVILPQPKVFERTLDLAHGRLTGRFDGVWNAAPSAQLLTTMQQRVLALAQTSLAQSVTPELQTASKRAVERAVHRLGDSLGWTVEIRWLSSGNQALPPA